MVQDLPESSGPLVVPSLNATITAFNPHPAQYQPVLPSPVFLQPIVASKMPQEQPQCKPLIHNFPRRSETLHGRFQSVTGVGWNEAVAKNRFWSVSLEVC